MLFWTVRLSGVRVCLASGVLPEAFYFSEHRFIVCPLGCSTSSGFRISEAWGRAKAMGTKMGNKINTPGTEAGEGGRNLHIIECQAVSYINRR